jgi:hypothetical protein
MWDPREVWTFANLFDSFMQEWPEVIAEMRADTHGYAAHLFRLAEVETSKYTNADVWEHLDRVLRHTMKWYEPKKGPFDKLFERNLREHLRKVAARAAQKARRRTEGERQALANRPEPDRVGAAIRRWQTLLVHVSADKMGPHAYAYLAGRLKGRTVKEVAATVSISEKTLWNKFGNKQKFGQLVRDAVRRTVLELPIRHCQLLVRHLKDEVGLATDEVVRLLGVSLEVDENTPWLAEKSLLDVLGWSEKLREVGSPRKREGVCSERTKLAIG